MAATGYDVAAGDTWALNELSSAVRQGTGNARANMRAFLQRPLRRRRHAAASARDGVRRRDRPGDDRPLPLPGAAAGLVRGCGLLERPEPLRQRLVAGGLRRRPQLRRRRRDPGGAARPAERVPPAPDRARGRRADVGGRRAELPGRVLQPARECRLALRRRLRLDGRPGRADAGLRLGADVRDALGRHAAASAMRGRRRTWPASRPPTSTRRPTRCSSGSPPRSPTRATLPEAACGATWCSGSLAGAARDGRLAHVRERGSPRGSRSRLPSRRWRRARRRRR